MALQKRKAVGAGASQLVKRAKAAQASKRKEAEEEHVDEVEEAEEEEEEEDEADEQENEQEVQARREEETVAARKKDLKAMAVGDIKAMAASSNLDTGNKADMIDAILKQEAAARAAERAHEAKIRDVLIKKKDELEALSVPELKSRCADAGAKGVMTKPARVEFLIKQWQEQDGVQKTMAKMVQDAREEELCAKDVAQLRKLCIKIGVDPFVKDVMVERTVLQESAGGHFAKPTVVADEDEEVSSKAGKSANMVDLLLANETNRKKEKEQKQEEEKAALNKLKTFKAMSVDELKKSLTSKGSDPAGKKKEDMVEALMELSKLESEVAAKKAMLKALSQDDLKKRMVRQGLEPGKKEAMVASLLAHDAKVRKEAQAWEGKVAEVLEKKRQELEEKPGAQLKELCASKGLKLGASKEDRVATLLEDAKANGEVDKMIASMLKEARRVELLAMEKDAVLKICEAAGAEPTVKEVMVERVLAHEAEFGRAEEEAASKRGAKRKARS